MTSSMPTSAATARAARSLSPVSRTGRRPRARRSAMASAEVAFGVSATTSTARTSPSHAAAMAVRPRSSAVDRAASSSSVRVSDQSARRRGRPTTRAWPSTTPSTPRPSRLVKDSTRGSPPSRSRAAPAIAWAIGCSLASSTAPTRRSASSSSVPATVCTSTRAIAPVVTVPVLSRTTVSTSRVDSRTSGPLMRMPSWAPRPVPTSSAVGVARPRAHGQAMISTDTAAVKAVAAGSPWPSQKPRVATARAITTGTNTADTRSARRCTGALPIWADSTSRPIWASWVSAPTRVASTTRRPPAFTVAPVTASPGPTSTGTGSPVSNEASMAEVPSATTPSVAIFSPGRATKRSPTTNRSTGMRTSAPSRSTLTSLAPSSSRARSAAPDRRLARASK